MGSVPVAPGSGLAEGFVEGVGEGLADGLGEGLGAGLGEGLGEGLAEGVGVGLGDGLAEGVGVPELVALPATAVHLSPVRPAAPGIPDGRGPQHTVNFWLAPSWSVHRPPCGRFPPPSS